MRRTISLSLFVILLNWNSGYPTTVRADNGGGNNDPAARIPTKTPIKHVVVIFDENNSFDHYFGPDVEECGSRREVGCVQLKNLVSPAFHSNKCDDKWFAAALTSY
jgi:hypothetical protein